MNQLDPRFVNAMLGLLTNPPTMCDLAVLSLFPETHQRFQIFAQMMTKPDIGLVYDWLHREFPTSLERNDKDDPNWLYIEMFKHIFAKAMDMKYESKRAIAIVT